MLVSISKGQETRQRIIAEAAAIFNQRGYERCSIQTIMEATGLEKGGIYRHFESKEELAAEAFDFAWRATTAKRRQGLESIANQADRIQQHIANFAHRAGIPGGCPLLNTAVDSENGNPVLRERVRAALADWQQMIVDTLESGKAAGTIRVSVDSLQAANHLIGTLEGAMLVKRIGRNEQPIRQAIEQLHAWVDSELRATDSLSSTN
ncbi:TetR/AcrR family transcriptional regulator [Acidicapsa dinghuensis]|uniref:TetR/AcrR family transcriptional regulator n=1 Tax=Acidicapsa dinghuensis TaxID=2218256 RepID=A0ABW1EMM0_9BACT|nr:TetR/AcrR family transcriptional regulator [Acidicapsa dinghuensis]